MSGKQSNSKKGQRSQQSQQKIHSICSINSSNGQKQAQQQYSRTRNKAKIKYNEPFLQSIKKYPQENEHVYHWVPWTQLQKLKYSIFIQVFEKQFIHGIRKQFYLFKLMSQLIKSRTPNQCRTFAYKMEKAYKDIQQIVNSIKSNYVEKSYKQQFKIYEKQIQEIISSDNQYKDQLSFYNYSKQIQQFNKLSHDSAENKQKQQQILKKDKKQQKIKTKSKQVVIENSSSIKQHKLKDDDEVKQQAIEEQYIQPSFKFQQNGANHPFNKFKNMNKMSHGNKIQQTLGNNKKITKQQKSKAILLCNYHWKQWLKASLELRSLDQQFLARKLLIHSQH